MPQALEGQVNLDYFKYERKKGQNGKNYFHSKQVLFVHNSAKFVKTINMLYTIVMKFFPEISRQLLQLIRASLTMQISVNG